ncbi:MAG: NADH-quinone oxidoreductase subunit [Solirubrobacteraceae bacterium]|jgi:NADH-quinone oxidoreductase subunit M|nr:NADH-quinone oxidoreductase subunit [Solirubrobacteraceae bacterium]
MTLSILIWLPLAIALAVSQLPPRFVGRVTALLSLAPLGIALSFLARFNAGQAGLQFVTDHTWISTFGIHYKVGLDGLNVALVVLTTLLFTAALAWAASREWERPRLFYFWLGLGQSAVLGAFCAQDLFLFVAFFDLMLIPFYFLTGSWGSGERVRATTKLVIYTLVGSFFMLVAAIATAVIASNDNGVSLTFVLSALRGLPLSHATQDWIFLCFAVAFLVKMPLVPFHGWLADGYRSMPIPAVAVFSGVVAKVAAYGFLRIVLPLFPYASVHYQTLMLVIALVSILWGTAIAFTTTNARLIVAYSSVAQLGFITLGIFSLRPQGGQGALLQMVNHGLVTAPLFFIVAALAVRAGGSEDIRDMGGLAFRAPVLAALFLIVALATLAMPGSSNFAGEFMILLGVFKAKLAISVIAFLGVIGAAVYSLRVYIRTMHNQLGPRAQSREISWRDGLAIVPLVAVILAFAFYPQFGLKRSDQSLRAAMAPAEIQEGLSPVVAGLVAGAPRRVGLFGGNGVVNPGGNGVINPGGLIQRAAPSGLAGSPSGGTAP